MSKTVWAGENLKCLECGHVCSDIRMRYCGLSGRSIRHYSPNDVCVNNTNFKDESNDGGID